MDRHIADAEARHKLPPPAEPFEIVTSLRRGLSMKPDYLLEDFLEVGEQALIYGQPKVGKTFMAIQLAVAVATGSTFLRWEAKAPKKVLYLNFEMGERVFAQRVCNNLPPPPKPLINPDEIADHYDQLLSGNLVFSCHPRSINLLDHRSPVKDLIAEHQPALVIFDTLSKTHRVDERANEKIGEVLQVMRGICRIDRSPVAHVIVHHARKPSMMLENSSYLTASEIRGGSAIRGEADLIIGLAYEAGGTRGGRHHRLTMEARNVQLSDLDIEFTDQLRFEIAPEQLSSRIIALLSLKLGASRNTPAFKKDLYQQICEECGCKISTVRKWVEPWLKKEIKEGRIIESRPSRREHLEGDGRKVFLQLSAVPSP